MIVCPNCNHQNPDGAVQCEACYTPLPAMTTCPSCHAAVQSDASFCGQCGFDLRTTPGTLPPVGASAQASSSPLPPTITPGLDVPDAGLPVGSVEIEPLVTPDPLMISSEAEFESTPAAEVPAIAPPAAVPSSDDFPDFPDMPDIPEVPAVPPTMPAMPIPQPTYPTAASTGSSSTQLQLQSARLLHVQTDSVIELPQNLSVIHIGKPNDRVPPDVDVAGFPNSEIVSRIHADIRVEGDLYYLEDVGSSNGTYVNNAPLPVGNRHRLRAGDRIALGKGDQVTFIFQIF